MPKASHARHSAGVTCQRRCSLPPLGGKLSLCRKSVALLQPRQTIVASPRWDMYSTLPLKTAHSGSCGPKRAEFSAQREKVARVQSPQTATSLQPSLGVFRSSVQGMGLSSCEKIWREKAEQPVLGCSAVFLLLFLLQV